MLLSKFLLPVLGSLQEEAEKILSLGSGLQGDAFPEDALCSGCGNELSLGVSREGVRFTLCPGFVVTHEVGLDQVNPAKIYSK